MRACLEPEGGAALDSDLCCDALRGHHMKHAPRDNTFCQLSACVLMFLMFTAHLPHSPRHVCMMRDP